MRMLPYQTVTSTGDVFHFEFPLHAETADPVRIEQLVSAMLDTIAKEIDIAGDISNGDLLQALTIVLAIRGRMIHAPHEIVRKMSSDFLASALTAVGQSDRQSPPAGHA